MTPLGTKLSTEVLVAFIDSVKERFGVEPVCHVLSQFMCKIAPSTYYAAKSRPPSARAQRDEQICALGLPVVDAGGAVGAGDALELIDPP